jgi:high-affinity iron transporter
MHCKKWLILLMMMAFLVGVPMVGAADLRPWEAAGQMQDALFAAQKAVLVGDMVAAQTAVTTAQTAAVALSDLPSDAYTALTEALNDAATAAGNMDAEALAGARGQAKGALYWGSSQLVQTAVATGDAETARQWLLVRDYRPSTRFTRPGADATLALHQMAATTDQTEINARVSADLLDTYQARLTEHVGLVLDNTYPASRRAEAAGQAQFYWRILRSAYAAQQSETAAAEATAQFDGLVTAVLQSNETEVQTLGLATQTLLNSFRAAPLSPDEEARRAGQLLRYLALVPVEYGRGVHDNQVMVPIEIQEAMSFMTGAEAAFADLRLSLDAIDAAQTAVLASQISAIAANLNAANRQEAVLPADQMEADSAALQAGLEAIFPEAWLAGNSDADFDVLASVLDQVETAVKQGDYTLAESARLEAYAIFDFGPEPRLLAFAPEQVAHIDGLFWQGYDGRPGLAQAVALQAAPDEIAAIRAELNEALAQAQLTLGDLPSAPGAIITNAAIIVFREGLESVVILAALMASMVGAYAHFRKPVVMGVLLSLVATAVTWWLAHQILSSLTRMGERLEAVVSLIAIAILLLITNWFFHKTYWTGWMAGFHQKKRRLLTAETGQILGLILLGFTSTYREGFETVLFLQALVLDAGTAVVLQGVALGMVGVIIVGVITFKLQARLPYKKMLVWTGVLIGLVLVTMVGKTVHVLQAVGWLGITPIKGVTFPYWAGLWFGLYATWQGILFQVGAATFVIGSYFAAEKQQQNKRTQSRQTAVKGEQVSSEQVSSEQVSR